MNNILSNIGDSIIININPLITGRVRFTGYTEVVSGETFYRSLERKFRISTDEIFWSEWKELTNENLATETYITENSLFIQVKYTRTGTDETGEIEFTSIDFLGTREEIKFVAPTLMNSIFAKLIGTSELQKLELNLFKKLYFRGILPQYITRAENVDYKEDKDFVDFFYSVARFFALIIRFFKRFENFRNDEELLREQIRGYGIYFDESNVSLEELQYIAQNILSIIQQRGTEMIFVRKGELLPNGKTAEINGEAVRLIRSRVCDEIDYDAIPKYKMGWCLNNSSPLYRGTARSYNLNKTKENTQDFQSLDNFILTKSGSGDYQLANLIEGKRVLKLTTMTSGSSVGLGGISGNADGDLLLIAEPKLDYEITFAFRVNTADQAKLKFGVRGYDINKKYLNDAFMSTNGNAVSGDFFELDLDEVIPNVWYNVRGIIHAYSTQFFESQTNMGRGTDVMFNNFFTKYIIPNIQVVADGETNVDIWDYKVRPLVRGKNIMPLRDGSTDSRSLGFIQASPMFYTYFKNNNNSLSVEEITDIIEKYLYPFNSINLFTIISNF